MLMKPEVANGKKPGLAEKKLVPRGGNPYDVPLPSGKQYSKSDNLSSFNSI